MSKNPKVPRYVLLLLLLAFLILWYAFLPSPLRLINYLKPPEDVSKLNSRELVEKYYLSLASGNIETAKQCMSDEFLKNMLSSIDPSIYNVKYLKIIRISQPNKIKLYGKNFEEVQIIAEYYSEYFRQASRIDGRQIDFVYVGRKTKTSPWKIISIGSGP